MPPTDLYTHCWNHPKIRENWRTVLAAVLLLIIGIGLVTMGIFSIANPENGSRGFVFLLAGTIHFTIFQICFSSTIQTASQLFLVSVCLQDQFALFQGPITWYIFGLQLLAIAATTFTIFRCLLSPQILKN